MTSQLVEYTAADGQVVTFEVDPLEGFEPVGIGQVAGRVRDAVEPVLVAAQEVLQRVKRLSPDGVELRFGVKVTGKANWVVAKASTEGNFEVVLSWQPRPGNAGPNVPGRHAAGPDAAGSSVAGRDAAGPDGAGHAGGA